MSNDYEIVPEKEISDLKKEIQKVKENPFGDNETSSKLYKTMDNLNESMNNMLNLFKIAADSMQVEEREEVFIADKIKPLFEKVDKIIDQNEKLAKAFVALVERMDDLSAKNSKLEQFIKDKFSVLDKLTVSPENLNSGSNRGLNNNLNHGISDNVPGLNDSNNSINSSNSNNILADGKFEKNISVNNGINNNSGMMHNVNGNSKGASFSGSLNSLNSNGNLGSVSSNPKLDSGNMQNPSGSQTNDFPSPFLDDSGKLPSFSEFANGNLNDFGSGSSKNSDGLEMNNINGVNNAVNNGSNFNNLNGNLNNSGSNISGGSQGKMSMPPPPKMNVKKKKGGLFGFGK